MKKALVLLTFFLVVMAYGGIISPPFYNSTPTVTFNAAGMDAPVVFGTPLCCASVGLTVTGYNILSYRISNDSLVLTAEADSSGTPGPIPLADVAMVILYNPSDTSAVFNRAQVYKAFLNEIFMIPLANGVTGPSRPIIALTALGSFRVYPTLSTLPGAPIAGASFKLNLIEGQSVGGACPPSFSDVTALVKGNDITLSWTETPVMSLVPCDTESYGPSFDVAGLATGSYTVYYEDSVIIGSIVVSNRLVVEGTVTEMHNPLSMLPFIRFIADAQVIAVSAPVCSWSGIPAAIDTLKATTDTYGHYSFDLPDNGTDYAVTVTAAGYAVQTTYTNNFPGTDAIPSVKTVDLELIPDSRAAETDVVVLATANGVPAESVSVSLTGGRELIFCVYWWNAPLMAKTAAAASFSGMTDADGIIKFTSVSLSPYIDYAYSGYRYTSNGTMSKTGIARFNAYISPDTLRIDLGTTAVEQGAVDATLANGISVTPNPFNSSAEIRFKTYGKHAQITIYNLKGQAVASFKNVEGNRVTWNAGTRPSGVYLVKAVVGKKQYVKKILLQK